MKKSLLFLVIIFMTAICTAQVKLEVNKEGAYRVPATVEWTVSVITADQEAIKYIDKFPQAIQGHAPIIVWRKEKVLKQKLIFNKLVEVEEHWIFYNSQTKNIDYIKGPPSKEERFSLFILLGLISVIFMIISEIKLKKKDQGLAAGAAFIGFVFAVLAIVFTLILSFFLSAAFAFVAFIVICLSKDENYTVATIIFCILMVIHMALLFV